MRKVLPIALLFILSGQLSFTQITIPQIKANFGVEADLRANFFDGFTVNGNDDWFLNTAGTGRNVIDTSGAAFLMSRYISNPASRQQPFFRSMRVAPYSVVNGRLLLDAIFIRDHHGDDSTVFASGSNKNGMSPGLWSCPVSQGIPDKNDILDIMMHVRRNGSNVTDSLWMFGGVSIDNTTGSRYFDFEMYQTDITYNRLTRTFMGFGPDAGHTSWQFDAAGNITRAGDIIFTAEFGTSGIQVLEARIWIHESAQSVTPVAFNWGTEFDGDGNGASYGYASIAPKSAGAFYSGLQSSNNTWAGPFGLILQNNSLVTNYSSKQFMEFSVNLSKLGLDPLATQNNACGMPFRRILVKSRASNSFTAELKDFVGPFSFFRARAAQASADIPMFCGASGVANICVDSAIETSLYTWTTTNGNIVGDTAAPCITVDQPGTYVVRQQLMDSCGVSYATDTVVITADPGCVVLKSTLTKWSGVVLNHNASLEWAISSPEQWAYYEIERSTDKRTYSSRGKISSDIFNDQYSLNDQLSNVSGDYVYYRLKMVSRNGAVQYSKVLSFPVRTQNRSILITPNPVRQTMQLSITVNAEQDVTVDFVDQAGRKIETRMISVRKGLNSIAISDLEKWKDGVYMVRVHTNEGILTHKMVLLK